MSQFELGIEGGTLVTGASRLQANVYVAGGRVANVTQTRHHARETFDASGLLAMPGTIDAHVHSWIRPIPLARTSRPVPRLPLAPA